MNRPSDRLEFGRVTLVPSQRLLLKNGQPIALTPKAFDLLVYLAARPGRLLTKDELLQAVWPDTVIEESNLSYHVFAIRKALGNGSDLDEYIETVPKRGYRFIAPVDVRDDDVEPGSPSPSIQRFQEHLWGRPAEPPMFSISPDGRHLLAAIQGLDGVAKLWVRTLSDAAARPLAGSEGFIMPPALWSPNSDAVAFANGGPLKRVAVAGGVPQHVCDLPAIAVGGTWNRDGVMLIGNPVGPLLRCSASGGSATPVTRTTSPLELHLMPSFLSDGRRFIYLRVHRDAPERSGVYVGDLEDTADGSEKRVLDTGFNALYVPASAAGGASVVFVRDGALYAQRFDDERLEFRGAAVRVADKVGSYLDYAFFAACPDILVYRSPDPLYRLTWFDRDGRELRRVGKPEPVVGLALSPSGDRALIARHVPHNVVDQDLWLFDVRRDANPKRLTFAPTLEAWPTWLTDEAFAYGASGGDRAIYRQTIDGEPRFWFQGGGAGGVTTVTHSPAVVYSAMTNATMRADLWVWTESGPPEGVPLITREGDQAYPQLSRDGRWLAYVSNETGRNEVFVASFDYDSATATARVGSSVPVSDGGGFAPRWRGDAKELCYLTLDGSVMAVDLDTAGGMAPGRARRLFMLPGVFPEWGLTTDGDQLLFAVPVEPPPPLQIVQHWQSMLPR